MTTQTRNDLAGKVILITGGAQGIGGATAQLCAERGARVIIADLKDTGEAHAESIRQNGGDAVFYKLDVRSQGEVSAMFDAVHNSHGQLDVLICAAGILQGQYLQPEELDLEVFERVMDINVKGMFLCTKYATPLLAESKGVMLLVGSGAGVLGGSSSIAYGTSKGAVNGLGMTLEGHLAPRGIRVNVICPGSLNTEMKRGVIEAQARKEGKDFEDLIARSNLGEPIGVARLIAFLASDDASYLKLRIHTR